MYVLTRGKVSKKINGEITCYDTTMVVSLMTPFLDYSCTTRYKDTPVIVRVTSSLHQTDLLEKSHQPFRNYKDKFYRKKCCYTNILRYFAQKYQRE
jgi:hypothetical protein